MKKVTAALLSALSVTGCQSSDSAVEAEAHSPWYAVSRHNECVRLSLVARHFRLPETDDKDMFLEYLGDSGTVFEIEDNPRQGYDGIRIQFEDGQSLLLSQGELCAEYIDLADDQ